MYRSGSNAYTETQTPDTHRDVQKHTSSNTDTHLHKPNTIINTAHTHQTQKHTQPYTHTQTYGIGIGYRQRLEAKQTHTIIHTYLGSGVHWASGASQSRRVLTCRIPVSLGEETLASFKSDGEVASGAPDTDFLGLRAPTADDD